MKVKVLFLIILFTSPLQAQIVPSSCIAPDSVVKKYKNDADRLAVNRVMFTINSTFRDSVVIDPAVRSAYLRALLSVFNATALPARDTVIKMFNIHRYIEDLNSVFIQADSSLTWMKSLRNNIIPTGYAKVDHLLDKYFLKKTVYYNWGQFSYHGVILKTDTNYNIFALANLFNKIPGVFNANPNNIFFGGTNITDSISDNFTNLIYSYGWGDCISGCIYKRYWKFKVYKDCSVEYLGSYGNPIPLTGVNIQLMEDYAVKIYPVPASGKLYIEQNGFDQLLISNCYGQLVFCLNNPEIQAGLDISHLPCGIYYLKAIGKKSKKILKFIVE